MSLQILFITQARLRLSHLSETEQPPPPAGGGMTQAGHLNPSQSFVTEMSPSRVSAQPRQSQPPTSTSKRKTRQRKNSSEEVREKVEYT